FVSSRVPRFKPQGKVAPWTDLAEHLQPDLLREYARRAGLVLSKLVREPSSRPLVDAVLSGILQDGEASGSKQELVQSFLRILRRENGFDILPWLKRFLSQGENEIKRSSLGLLANAIEFSDTQVENHVLLALRSWLPETVGPASGLNSQTAALLAPRVAMYRTFGRTRDREHGKVDRLAPLVDLNREDGFLPEYKIAIDLLPRAVDGKWVHTDLNLLQRLVEARWKIDEPDTAQTAATATPLRVTFPVLAALDRKFGTKAWTETDSRQLGLVGLFVEATAFIMASPDVAEAKRKQVIEESLRQVALRLDKES